MTSQLLRVPTQLRNPMGLRNLKERLMQRYCDRALLARAVRLAAELDAVWKLAQTLEGEMQQLRDDRKKLERALYEATRVAAELTTENHQLRAATLLGLSRREPEARA